MKQIDDLVKNIQSETKNLKQLAIKTREQNPELIQNTQDIENNFKICGVDGGFAKKQLAGSGVMIRRAIGVCFEYKKNNLIKTTHHPSARIEPEIKISQVLSDRDFQILGNLLRMESELKIAIECIEKFAPDIIIVDGSIVVHPSSVPAKDSPNHELFLKISELLINLYEKATQTNTVLVGAVEDSKSRRLSEKLKVPNINDSIFLFHLLNEGEYTKPIRYSDSPDVPVLAELGEWSEKIYVTYLRIGKYDLPLRLDFLNSDPSKITAIISKISRIIPNYSYPSVLIEADARSKLEEQEVDVVWRAIRDKTCFNPLFFDLRRNQRPI